MRKAFEDFAFTHDGIDAVPLIEKALDSKDARIKRLEDALRGLHGHGVAKVQFPHKINTEFLKALNDARQALGGE